MDPIDVAARGTPNPDPAAIELTSPNALSIDIGQLLGSRAGAETELDLDGFEQSTELRDNPRIEPLLGLVSRTIESTLGVLDLPHLRVLVLLSRRDTVSVAELATLMKLNNHRLSALLDAMESSGWITSDSWARGIGEAIAIRQQGRELVETLTLRRQLEIDDILGRMSEDSRAELARAFNSFAAAAGEVPTSEPRNGIAPRRP